jgi:hypothetical protein
VLKRQITLDDAALASSDPEELRNLIQSGQVGPGNAGPGGGNIRQTPR